MMSAPVNSQKLDRYAIMQVNSLLFWGQIKFILRVEHLKQLEVLQNLKKQKSFKNFPLLKWLRCFHYSTVFITVIVLCFERVKYFILFAFKGSNSFCIFFDSTW